MSSKYSRDHLKISVVKILHTLGWHSINTAPLDVLTDILDNYLFQLVKSANCYANEFGSTQPNLDHLSLTFRDMGISVTALGEYVKYVNFGQPPCEVPLYPIPKDDHLNFLKPGSQEVVTRSVHIPEHLPPMQVIEGNKADTNGPFFNLTPESNDEYVEIEQDTSPQDNKKSGGSKRDEAGSRPTREISSVIMTTSGFLSPAREGKLPESKTPIQTVEYAPALSDSEIIEPVKRPIKVEKKYNPAAHNPPSGTETTKKRSKFPSRANQSAKAAANLHDTEPGQKSNEASKINRALFEARLKTEKLNTTITPVVVNAEKEHVNPVGKLLTEPDKKKIDILKKISNVKNERTDVKIKEDIKSEGSSPDLIIDEPEVIPPKFPQLSNDITIEPMGIVHRSPAKLDTPYFDDDSHSGPPSTPKTPELISHSPTFAKEKRKRKEKRVKKTHHQNRSPHQLDNYPVDVEMERPKTPEAHVFQKLDLSGFPFGNRQPLMPSMNFPFHFGGPGLIPAPFANPLFPPLNFSAMDLQNIPSTPYAAPLPVKTEPQQTSPYNLSPVDVKMSPDTTQIVKEERTNVETSLTPLTKADKMSKEEKKEKRDKLKKRNKKDKLKKKEEKKRIKEKDRVKKEKKEKRKDKELKDNEGSGMKITLKIKSPSPPPPPAPPVTPDVRKLNIKAIVKKEEEPKVQEEERETSPDLAKISALVVGPPKPKSSTAFTMQQPAFSDSFPSSSSDNYVFQMRKPVFKPIPKEPRSEPFEAPIIPPVIPSKYIDAEGNEVWICPACSRQDDGSPMIGCDGCDAWYHWVCVGIQVPPDASEDWYCRYCLLKKNEDFQNDKQKKRRRKKEKKEH